MTRMEFGPSLLPEQIIVKEPATVPDQVRIQEPHDRVRGRRPPRRLARIRRQDT